MVVLVPDVCDCWYEYFICLETAKVCRIGVLIG